MAKKTIVGGRLIFFDGIDGVGKTTQLQAVKTELGEQGWLVKESRIHGGTPIGEALREVSFMELPRPAGTDLYISLAMHQALIEQVNQWRGEGAIILIDRSPLSIIGYQVKGDGLAAELGWQSVQQSMLGFGPDLTLVYTADVATAHDRARQKAGWADYFSSKPAGYFEKAQQGYLEAAKKYRAVVIDANKPADEVYSTTAEQIKRVLADADASRPSKTD